MRSWCGTINARWCAVCISVLTFLLAGVGAFGPYIVSKDPSSSGARVGVHVYMCASVRVRGYSVVQGRLPFFKDFGTRQAVLAPMALSRRYRPAPYPRANGRYTMYVRSGPSRSTSGSVRESTARSTQARS
jgi:hypothetical protein